MLITDAAVRETAAAVAQSLGGDWKIDPEAPADGAAHLMSTDGKGISFRPIFGGTTVQLWITGNTPPPPPTDATPTEQSAYEAQISVRLSPGHRYNKAATLVTENDEEPETIIMRTLEDDLIPAFEYKPGYVGHRPWADLFDNALSEVMDETKPATDTTPRDRAPEPHTAPDNIVESTERPADAEPGSAAEQQPQPAATEDTPHEPAKPPARANSRTPRKRPRRTSGKGAK
ncbi:hypothetical protein GR925_01685 [Streptomyces sp. HUCO-GS316]|uniref:hypothetical protein n=1 Tax=Streptomyces sp. HUCO-GS316 TaxID=2692198 RepID=UPI00137073AC|nr:hypothetical protein [Streptomyces sp. HUCO-GS316]MXM62194.1 hypothetical protein [Streptomyces sp. HUCO-GS316]